VPGILLGALAIALAYGAAFLPGATTVAPWLMMVGIALLVCSLCLLGTRRRGGARPLALLIGLALLALVLLGGFGAALVLPPEGAAAPLLLGLPRRAALLVYGIGLLPALFLPLIYAFSFDAAVLSQAELRELRSQLADLARERTLE
jgi:hypothetical protein